MTTCLGKSCSFVLPRVPFINCCQFMYLVVFGFEGRMWDLIVTILDYCLSFYFRCIVLNLMVCFIGTISWVLYWIISQPVSQQTYSDPKKIHVRYYAAAVCVNH